MNLEHHPSDNLVSVFRCRSYDPEEITSALRRLLASLFSKKENPLVDLVNKGDTVLIKPNWIREGHESHPQEWESVITHPILLTALLDFVARALQGTGRITIADGPETDSSFSKILGRMPVERWTRTARDRGVELEIIDLREDEWVTKAGVVVERRKILGDPRGSVTFDLGHASAFASKAVPPLGYYGADYDSQETVWAHSGGRHIYRVSRSVIEADVFINVPKMKTHRKAGITASMKNLVGINTYRNYLPHHSVGTPEEGGDQFPCHSPKAAAERRIGAKLKTFWLRHPSWTGLFIPAKVIGLKIFGDRPEVIRSGNWYGNDTLWRTIVDLNRILLYGNPDGSLRKGGLSKAKRYLALVDGIVAGEGNGPGSPDRVDSGLLLAGSNPVAIDCAAAKIMGFDYLKVPYLRESFAIRHYPLVDFNYQDIHLISDREEWNEPVRDLASESVFRFKSSPGWQSHIELEEYLKENAAMGKQEPQ